MIEGLASETLGDGRQHSKYAQHERIRTGHWTNQWMSP